MCSLGSVPFGFISVYTNISYLRYNYTIKHFNYVARLRSSYINLERKAVIPQTNLSQVTLNFKLGCQ